MQDASNAEMRRQIRREGRRWGLVPLVRQGRVCVGQKALCAVQRGSELGQMVDRVRYVADITMSHGFVGVLMNQRRLDERDANARYDERERRINAENQKIYDDKMHEHDATARKYIAAMGWDEFVQAALGPDPRTPEQRRAAAEKRAAWERGEG